MERTAVRVRRLGRPALYQRERSPARSCRPHRFSRLGPHSLARARESGARRHWREPGCLRPVPFWSRLRTVVSAPCWPDRVLSPPRRARTDPERNPDFPSRRMSETRDLLDFYTNASLLELGAEADRVRQAKHPGDVVTYIIDRNINYTNVCVADCGFCAFARRP